MWCTCYHLQRIAFTMQCFTIIVVLLFIMLIIWFYSDFKETGAAALQYFPLVHKGTKRHNTGRSRNNVLTRYGPIGSGKLKTCSDTVRLPSPFKKYYTMQWVSKKLRSGFSVSYRKAQRNFLGQSIIPLKGMIINIKLCFMKTTL